jgi:CYTH domain-containing protein
LVPRREQLRLLLPVVEAEAVVAVAVDKALQQVRRLPVELPCRHYQQEVEQHQLRAAGKAVVEVAVEMAPDRQLLQQWNGSFTSKAMARTARVRQSTM